MTLGLIIVLIQLVTLGHIKKQVHLGLLKLSQRLILNLLSTTIHLHILLRRVKFERIWDPPPEYTHTHTTGSFIMNVIFHTLSKDIKEAPCELKLVAKVRYIYDILIFNG